MNIFASYKCPIKSAEYLDDKRVVKMVLESAQMLSTVIATRNIDIGNNYLYKPTHVKHPCTVWVGKDIKNFAWLCNHFKALCVEYEKRYNKIHKCSTMFHFCNPELNLIEYDWKGVTFVNCTIYKDEKNVHKAYKKYLAHKWENDKRRPTWYGKNKKR